MVRSSNISFVLDFSPTSSGRLFPRNRDSLSHKRQETNLSQRILVWPSLDALRASLTQSKCIDLEKPRSIDLDILSGKDDVLNASVTVRPASAGLRLHTADAVALDAELDLLHRSEPGSISIGGLSAETTIAIRIPYSLDNDLREIDVHMSVEYSTVKGTYNLSYNTCISTVLPLAINVQDIFTKRTLISNFSINTSTAVPVYVKSCAVKGSPDFRPLSQPLDDGGMVVFPNQPLSFVSKINRIGMFTRSSALPVERKMLLEIEYHCLDSGIIAVIEHCFLEDLARSPFKMFSLALRPYLQMVARKRFSVEDLGSISIGSEICIGNFEEWSWDSIVNGFPPHEADGLSRWIKAWHNARLSLSSATILTDIRPDKSYASAGRIPEAVPTTSSHYTGGGAPNAGNTYRPTEGCSEIF